MTGSRRDGRPGRAGEGPGRVLFLVHVEEAFRDLFPGPGYAARLARAVAEYDRVICLVSMIDGNLPLRDLRLPGVETWLWPWGAEPGEPIFGDPGEEAWIIPSPGSGHEHTWVPEEIRDAGAWAGVGIEVGGGADGECLADWENVMRHQRLPYARAEHLVYAPAPRPRVY